MLSILLQIFLSVNILNLQAQTQGLPHGSAIPKEFEGVGIDKSVIGKSIQADLYELTDEEGNTKKLKDFMLPGKPTVLSMVYYNCPSLCNLHMNQAAELFDKMSLRAGKDYNWILVSMEHKETPELAFKKKVTYLDQFEAEGAETGWKFLTTDEKTLKALTEEIGFSFKWDEKTKQYAHSAAYYILSPEAKISQIVPGIGTDQDTLRLSLVEASEGKVGGVIDKLLLFCFQFDPKKNKYTLYAYNLMRIAGLFTVLIMAVLLIPMWRKERKGE